MAPGMTASWAGSPSHGPSPTPTGPPRTSCATCPSTCASPSGPRRAPRPGSPRKVNEYLFEDTPARLSGRLAAAEDADALVFGHTHNPWVHDYGDVWLLNCGSVDKPKDGDPAAPSPSSARRPARSPPRS